jgi:hypothetical protein
MWLIHVTMLLLLMMMKLMLHPERHWMRSRTDFVVVNIVLFVEEVLDAVIYSDPSNSVSSETTSGVKSNVMIRYGMCQVVFAAVVYVVDTSNTEEDLYLSSVADDTKSVVAPTRMKPYRVRAFYVILLSIRS